MFTSLCLAAALAVGFDDTRGPGGPSNGTGPRGVIPNDLLTGGALQSIAQQIAPPGGPIPTNRNPNTQSGLPAQLSVPQAQSQQQAIRTAPARPPSLGATPSVQAPVLQGRRPEVHGGSAIRTPGRVPGGAGGSALQAQQAQQVQQAQENLQIELMEQQQMQSYILQKQQEKEVTYRTLVSRAYQADEETLRAALKSKSGAERFAAAYAIGERQLLWYPELIERLTDSNSLVRQAARRSLIILSFLTLQEEQFSSAGKSSDKPQAVDFGPKQDDDKPAQEEAARKWREWWNDHTKSKQSDIRVVSTEANLDARAAKLSADLVFGEPSRQAEVLARYGKEKGIVYTEAMANALSQLEGDSLKKGRELLAERLSRMTAATLRDRLTDPRAELRRAAALAWAAKDDRNAVPELIPMLQDPEDIVVRGVKAALKSLTGQDFGPPRGAGAAERTAAVNAWKAWWRKQS